MHEHEHVYRRQSAHVGSAAVQSSSSRQTLDPGFLRLLPRARYRYAGDLGMGKYGVVKRALRLQHATAYLRYWHCALGRVPGMTAESSYSSARRTRTHLSSLCSLGPIRTRGPPVQPYSILQPALGSCYRARSVATIPSEELPRCWLEHLEEARRHLWSGI